MTAQLLGLSLGGMLNLVMPNPLQGSVQMGDKQQNFVTDKNRQYGYRDDSAT